MFSTKVNSLGVKTQSQKASANAFVNAGLKQSAKTLSGNGALKYSTSGCPFVDNFSNQGVYKNPRSFEDISRDCSTLYGLDKTLFAKFAIYLRMINRKTQVIGYGLTESPQVGGELKHESIMRMLWLHHKNPELFWNNIHLFLSAGSMKDIFVMLRYDLMYHGWDNRVLDWKKFGDLILTLLDNSNTVNLLKKYLPQIKSGSNCKTLECEANTLIAKWICSLLFGNKQGNSGSTYKLYRKLKTSGTAHEWQQLISQRKFDKIEFDKIHGRALNKLVKTKFLKNQGLDDKYAEWIGERETAKYTGYVHELLCEIQNTTDNNMLATINAQFNELVNKSKDGDLVTNMIVVRDTSGSMGSKAIGTKYTSNNIAKALALYFSSFLKGSFADSWIEFASVTKMHKWHGSNVIEKWKNDRSEAYGSTNFQGVIDLFCTLKNTVNESEFPTGIICISDGEFNSSGMDSNLEVALNKLRQAGFSDNYVKNFKIVLWNIPNGFYGSKSSVKFETYGPDANAVYMSGYSAAQVKFLSTGKIESPRDLFDNAMNQELIQLVR